MPSSGPNPEKPHRSARYPVSTAGHNTNPPTQDTRPRLKCTHAIHTMPHHQHTAHNTYTHITHQQILRIINIFHSPSCTFVTQGTNNSGTLGTPPPPPLPLPGPVSYSSVRTLTSAPSRSNDATAKAFSRSQGVAEQSPEGSSLHTGAFGLVEQLPPLQENGCPPT